jgi:rhodanese-related sulfurtransferase
MEKLLLDVRTREEFVMSHIRGAICIPHYDLGLCADFLRGKEISLYCNTERRSALARDRLAALGINARVVPLAEQEAMEWVEGSIVCAMNHVLIRPGHEEMFMEKAMRLCRMTESMDGFLGSKTLEMSGLSGVGSFVGGDLTRVRPKPLRMVLLTFWKSKEAHERSHSDPEFKAVFESLAEHLAEMPREEFYEVLK